MNDLFHPFGVWPAILVETGRYWLRRHRILIALVILCVLVGALLASLQVDSAKWFLVSSVIYCPVILGLVCMSGIVSDDRTSGVIVLWFQKPGLMHRVYAIRYLVGLVLLAALTVPLAMLVAGVGVAADLIGSAKAVRVALVMIPLTLLPAAMVFAFSAWGVRRDSVAALLTIVIGIALVVSVAFQTGPSAGVMKVMAFPIDAILSLAGMQAESHNQRWAILTIVGQFAAWSLLGLLGLRLSTRALQHR